jgi:hypothetical protein
MAQRFARLRLEDLEDRMLLSGGIQPDASRVIEDFEDPNRLAAYTTVLRYAPAAELSPAAAHDGGLGLVKHDGYEWLIRNDYGAQVHPGETISAWVDLAGTADGRAYFGFGATPNDPLGPLSTGGTLSLVLAPNTDQLLLQDNSGFAFRTLGGVAQHYQLDTWYRLEVDWGAGGAITGRLYDSDGFTLLNTVTGSATDITAGGIAFRGFGSDKYFDTVTVNDGTRFEPPVPRNLPPAVPVSGQPEQPPPIQPQDGMVLPFAYQSVPGTGLDIALAAFNQLQQVAIVGDTVGLAAANTSANVGTVEMGWGPVVQGLVDDGIPVETPLLQQYIFRQQPGEPTELIGESDLKHFFDSSQTDTQHLGPGETDIYGSSLNADQDFYSSAADLNPVTGAVDAASLNYFGPRNADGLNQYVRHTYDSPIQYLLQVPVADLDPTQNPPGTRWFLAGNLWVPGDQDTGNNSRWVEITPSYNGTGFTFSYPHGSGGQFNLRTLPGLGAGPAVSSQTPIGLSDGPVGSVRLTFNRPINPDTFTPDQVASFTGPNGPLAVTDITPVAGSNNTQFDLRFDAQGTLGVYTLVIGPGIQDTAGNPMDQNEDGVPGQTPDDQYTAQFAIRGPKVLSSTPTLGLDAYPVDHIRVTFNKLINPDTFTPDQVVFTGPSGPVAVTGVAMVPNSGGKQFDVQFVPLSDIGTYTLVIGPNIEDLAGNPMDQDGDYVAGEAPNDQYLAVLTIRSSTLGPDGFGYTAAVTPYQAADIVGQPGTFTVIDHADDESDPVDLGTNTFSFYGVSYTGNNRLYVSSNGLITFGSANSEYQNTDLTSDPTQPAIAPLWADWLKNAGEPTGPMVVAQFADYDDNGVPHQLILEWNHVHHYGYSGLLTFQAVLGLNTGGAPSDIVFNYLDLQSGDVWAEGNNATVGIKAAGTQGPNRLLVSSAGASPFVGTGKAILVSVPSDAVAARSENPPLAPDWACLATYSFDGGEPDDLGPERAGWGVRRAVGR